MDDMAMDEAKAEYLEEILTDWQHVMLFADKWLTWKKDEYPIIVGGVITVGFMLYWFLNPPVVSAAAIAVMMVCLADYLVPRVSSLGVLKLKEWSDDDNVKYKEICRNMASIHSYIMKCYEWASKQRELQPKIFFCGALICLLLLAFIAGAIPNLLLIYMTVMFIVLLPGLHKRGILLRWKIISLEQFIKVVKNMREGKLKAT